MAIYLIGTDEGVVKIGLAENPRARLAALQTGSGATLRLLAVIPGDRETEKLLHIVLSEHRKDGEWFSRCPAIERLIAKYLTPEELLIQKNKRGHSIKVSTIRSTAHDAELIRALGGASGLSKKIGISLDAAKKWVQRGIPFRSRPVVLHAARAAGLGIDEQQFLRIPVFEQSPKDV